jgi:hypothetical protein
MVPQKGAGFKVKHPDRGKGIGQSANNPFGCARDTTVWHHGECIPACGRAPFEIEWRRGLFVEMSWCFTAGRAIDAFGQSWLGLFRSVRG